MTVGDCDRQVLRPDLWFHGAPPTADGGPPWRDPEVVYTVPSMLRGA